MTSAYRLWTWEVRLLFLNAEVTRFVVENCTLGSHFWLLTVSAKHIVSAIFLIGRDEWYTASDVSEQTYFWVMILWSENVSNSAWKARLARKMVCRLGLHCSRGDMVVCEWRSSLERHLSSSTKIGGFFILKIWYYDLAVVERLDQLTRHLSPASKVFFEVVFLQCLIGTWQSEKSKFSWSGVSVLVGAGNFHDSFLLRPEGLRTRNSSSINLRCYKEI